VSLQLEQIIRKALEKDRNLRYQHASEMRSDLARLKRDTESGKCTPIGASSASFKRAGSKHVLSVGLTVGLVLLITSLAALYFMRGSKTQRETPEHPSKSLAVLPLAVLPLQNTSASKELDFLRLGLADDIATTLSYFPALSIRPFATTSRSLLQDVLSDFLEVEGILSKLQIVEALQLTAKQMKLYKEIVARVNELVRD
jgi:hypothetical protein